jgi:hypothetical protein
MRNWINLFESTIINEAEQSTLNSKGQIISRDPDAIARFWQWFGKSKVKNKQGQPLVMYHGTTGVFNSFDPNKSNSHTKTGVPHSTFFFTDHPAVATSYITQDADAKDFATSEIRAAYEALLARKGSFDEQLQFLHEYPLEPKPVFKQGGSVMPVYLRMTKPLIVDAKGYHWNDIYFKPKEYRQAEEFSGNEIAAYAQQNGYDGMVLKKVKDVHKGEAHLSTVYAVFSPQQVKSALSNTGQYGAGGTIDESVSLTEARMQDGAWLNPSAREIGKLVAEKDMRGVAVGNDIWLNYAYEDTHFDLRNRLGLPGFGHADTDDIADGFNFYVCADHVPFEPSDENADQDDNQGGRTDWVDVGVPPSQNFTVPGGIVYTDCGGKVALRNRAFARLVGKPVMESQDEREPEWKTIIRKLQALPYADSITVFGSVARGEARLASDVDIFCDSEDAPSGIMRIASQHYGALDPFYVETGVLMVRNDYATGWTRAKNARDILANIRKEGVPLNSITV